MGWRHHLLTQDNTIIKIRKKACIEYRSGISAMRRACEADPLGRSSEECESPFSTHSSREHIHNLRLFPLENRIAISTAPSQVAEIQASPQMTIEVIEMAVATAMHLALVLRTLPFLLVGKAEIYPQMATDM